MSLLKRGNTWHSRIMHEGKNYQQSLRTTNHTLAVRREAVIHAALLKGDFSFYDSKKCPSLMELEPRLLAYWQSNVKPSTHGFYKDTLKTLSNFGQLWVCKLSRVDEQLIETFTQRRLQDHKAVATVNNELRVLRVILRLAHGWKLIHRVPKVKVLSHENMRDFVLTPQMVEDMVKLAYVNWPRSAFRYLLPFLVDTGCRISEACDLKWEQIEFADGKPVSIQILKGKSKFAKRTIPLTPRAATALQAALDISRCAYAFTPITGRMAWPEACLAPCSAS